MSDATRPPRADGAPTDSEIPETIRAREIILVDRNGTERAQIGFVDDDHDMVQLALAGPDGNPTVAVTADDSGPSIGLVGENGLRMMLAMGPRSENAVIFEIKNGEGEDQFLIRLPSEGALEMAGWPGWANERLNELAGVTQPALRMLAAEFRGLVGQEHRSADGEDEDFGKIAAALHHRGVTGRQKPSRRGLSCRRAPDRHRGPP